MSIKLVYYEARGLAEPIRMTLRAAGKSFEDVQLKFDQWEGEKKNAPYKQIPYMVYNGKKYGECKAIASFIARECGLAGKTSIDAMRIDEVYSLVQSFYHELSALQYGPDAEKAEKLDKLNKEGVPTFLGYFENMAKEAGKGYMVGDSLTQADLTVYDITCTLQGLCPKVLDKFPQVQRVRQSVETNKQIKAYLDNRPKQDY